MAHANSPVSNTGAREEPTNPTAEQPTLLESLGAGVRRMPNVDWQCSRTVAEKMAGHSTFFTGMEHNRIVTRMQQRDMKSKGRSSTNSSTIF